MKLRISISVMLFTIFVNAQTTRVIKGEINEVDLKSLTVELEINSAEDLEQLDLENIKSLVEESNSEVDLELIVHCNKENAGENGIVTESTFTLKSTSDKIDGFLVRTEKLKNAITKIYQ